MYGGGNNEGIGKIVGVREIEERKGGVGRWVIILELEEVADKEEVLKKGVIIEHFEKWGWIKILRWGKE